MAESPVYFDIYTDSAGEWRWTLYARNGRIVADSAEGYTTKDNCLHGIALVKASFNAPVYQR